MSAIEEVFALQLQADGLPTPVRQFRFHHTRKWLADFAWPDKMVMAEIDGGVFARKGAKKCRLCGQIPSGRHTSGKGFGQDCEKYNEGVKLGWRVYRFTPKMVNDGTAVRLITDALGYPHKCGPECNG